MNYETVQEHAEREDHQAALKWADHRAECLEAEIRRLREVLRSVSDAMIAGDTNAAMQILMSRAALALLAADRPTMR